MNYLVIGPEEYLKRRFLEKLKKSVLNGKVTQFNFETFRAGSSSAAEILDSSSTLPILSERRITVVKDVDKFSAGEKESILKYLKSPAPSTVLVLLSYSSRVDKFLAEASRLTKAVWCNKLSPGELNLWIRQEFTALNKNISPQLANLVREGAGDDLFNLKNEVEKIALFAGEASHITQSHLDAALGSGAYETAFKLADLVLERKTEKIFPMLEGLLTKERPHRILSLLAWHFRKRNLTKALETILEGDLFMKRGVMAPEDALMRVLVKLCA